MTAADDRTQVQRFHDALWLACSPLPGVCLVRSWHQPLQPSLSPLPALP
jgi:hypothetical protein